eukprot:TRINITY_DN14175_c0_g2_i19.p9 TRINITY_DN14175_c0_g2~~TRINITY_DN14175_c0_g2_i19.p9  ORF type:complete len:128 (+),score=11.27 TRINITY_DN14175_c0_g2_i19:17-400(+)
MDNNSPSSKVRQNIMGRTPFTQVLSGKTVYCCSNCRCQCADEDDIVSKSFQGRYGRAYLFSHVVNISLGPEEKRMLITGRHTVADIFCAHCNAVLGWKYEEAFEQNQKYKEGKYIIEKAKVMLADDW